ncbi:unnamed protein product [Ilex paraguariensis]|uniref:Transmembrane protein n=1 Tax=Ilex paraguariensis TaxID=185542 RepID=A0ABC8SJU6_9AQUA
MKTTVLAWLFIILCAQVLSSLAIEDFVTFRQDVNEVKGRSNLEGDGNDRDQKEAKHEIVYSTKVARARGSNGGANIVHQPRPNQRSDVSIPNSPTFFMSIATVCLSFGLVLVIHF